jgi:hypothetical protein
MCIAPFPPRDIDTCGLGARAIFCTGRLPLHSQSLYIQADRRLDPHREGPATPFSVVMAEPLFYNVAITGRLAALAAHLGASGPWAVCGGFLTSAESAGSGTRPGRSGHPATAPGDCAGPPHGPASGEAGPGFTGGGPLLEWTA